MNRKLAASLIDHTLLKPEATTALVESLCREAAHHSFKTVCVNPRFVKTCVNSLRGTSVGVCTVVGFPLGANETQVKAAEARQAIAEGASEVDMVLWVGGVLGGALDSVENDIHAVAEMCSHSDTALKVILETALLNEEQIVQACHASVQAGAHWVKTSTGFGPGGASVEAVRTMYHEVHPHGLRVKASGGIRSLADMLRMCDAGAERIGTSSGVAILGEIPE